MSLTKKVPRAFFLAVLVLFFFALNSGYYIYGSDSYKTAPAQSDNQKGGTPPGTTRHGAFRVDEAEAAAPAAATPTKPLILVPTSHTADNDNNNNYGNLKNQPPSAPEVNAIAYGYDDDNDDPRPLPAQGQCYPELDFLRHAQTQRRFSKTVRYSRKCIQPVFSSKVNRDEVVQLPGAIDADQITVDVENCSNIRPAKCVPVQLKVPRPYSKAGNYSHVMFGIATDFDRLRLSVPTFAHWLKGSEAKLVALVTDLRQRTRSEVADLEQKFTKAGVDARVVGPVDESFSTSQSHFAVLVHMLKENDPMVKWYGLVDDDTFFPDLKPLSDALSTLNHDTDVYAGTLSEDFMNVRIFGFMAYGGAGAYLSAPLAKKLGSRLEKCIQEASGDEGDIIIRDCVYKISKAKLTLLPGLYQQDLRDDASGFFESGVNAINFHHWKSWFRAPVMDMATASTFCGSCLLQRWQFGADTILSNGYSIVKYTGGLGSIDLSTMEGTWSNANPDFDFSIGPLRRKLWPHEKKSHKLIAAKIDENGHLKQLYLWKGDAESGEMDEVIELVWEK